MIVIMMVIIRTIIIIIFYHHYHDKHSRCRRTTNTSSISWSRFHSLAHMNLKKNARCAVANALARLARPGRQRRELGESCLGCKLQTHTHTHTCAHPIAR